jgi:hypothetical protein
MGNGDLSAIPPIHFPFFNPFTAFCEEFYSRDEGSEILKKHERLCAKIHGVKSQMTMILTLTRMIMPNFKYKYKETCFITYKHLRVCTISLRLRCMRGIS